MKPATTMRLSNVLRTWRWGQRLTVRQAAVLMSMSQATYSRVERGWPMDGNTLRKILAWLLGDEDA